MIFPRTFESPCSPDEERDLGMRILSGDRAAEEELFRRNVGRAVQLWKRFRIPAGMTADDLAQACFLGLWKAVLRFDPRKGGFYAEHCIRDAVRDAARKAGHAMEGQESIEEPAVDQPPESAVEWSDDVYKVIDSLKLLDEHERAVIERQYWHGRKYSQIGPELGIPARRAQYLAVRAIGKLRRVMGA